MIKKKQHYLISLFLLPQVIYANVVHISYWRIAMRYGTMYHAFPGFGQDFYRLLLK